MDFHANFQRMMQDQTEMALATCVDARPNVRIVNFYYNPQNNTLYFSTFRDNDKIHEILANRHVSLTTIPKIAEQHIRIKKGIAKKSSLTIHDVKDAFSKKIPAYEEIIIAAGDALDVYEIHFEKALVILDYNTSQEISVP